MENNTNADIVIGAGLAGLAGATYLARAGRTVVVLERAGQVGGRAVTQERSGFSFNLGPHALYRHGAAASVLRELGVEIKGGRPAVDDYALHRGHLRRLPSTPWSLLTTDLFGLSAKLETGRLFATLGRIDPTALSDVSLDDWLEDNVRRPEVRELVRALARLATYANDPSRLSARVAIAQLQLAVKGVQYLDGGWQTLVDGLRRAAEYAGVRIVTNARVAAVESDDIVRLVRLDSGATYAPSAVIIATSPSLAAALVDLRGETALRRWADEATPVRVATLDVGLRRLPRPAGRFALGIDRPLYLSVHSAVARLAPEGGAMIHVTKYLAADDGSNPNAVERELEEFLERLQPGWREEVVERRFLPGLVVVNDLAAADRGGPAGRPATEVPDVRNLYLAGDWVGPEGWLADAGLASAKRAAQCALGAGPQHVRRTPEAVPVP